MSDEQLPEQDPLPEDFLTRRVPAIWDKVLRSPSPVDIFELLSKEDVPIIEITLDHEREDIENEPMRAKVCGIVQCNIDGWFVLLELLEAESIHDLPKAVLHIGIDEPRCTVTPAEWSHAIGEFLAGFGPLKEGQWGWGNVPIGLLPPE